MSDSRSAEVAIVGGGPAGAAVAIELASAGHEVVLFERRSRPAWRACGVYSSPLSRLRLDGLGVPADELAELVRPIGAMVLHPLTGGGPVRLEYPAPGNACGFDRVRLDAALLEAAHRAGAQVRRGAAVRRVDLARAAGGGDPRLLVSESGGSSWWRAGIVVGADGPASIVARSAGVTRPVRRFRRAGITFHRADPGAAPRGQPMDAQMFLGRGWYCGVAPVPGDRVNVGIVVDESHLRAQLAAPGDLPAAVSSVMSALPARAWQSAPATDEPRVQLPLAHRVGHASGPGFVLVGDAAGFLDPLSGEGLHRGLVSASLAASAIRARSRGDRKALSDYDRRLRARFRNKDLVSWLLQAFLAQPALLGYALARLGARSDETRTFALALADIVPASRILDPRYLARVLRP